RDTPHRGRQPAEFGAGVCAWNAFHNQGQLRLMCVLNQRRSRLIDRAARRPGGVDTLYMGVELEAHRLQVFRLLTPVLGVMGEGQGQRRLELLDDPSFARLAAVEFEAERAEPDTV